MEKSDKEVKELLETFGTKCKNLEVNCECFSQVLLNTTTVFWLIKRTFFLEIITILN